MQAARLLATLAIADAVQKRIAGHLHLDLAAAAGGQCDLSCHDADINARRRRESPAMLK
jgi:NAD/NADP transhydrogenase alpha subunit